MNYSSEDDVNYIKLYFLNRKPKSYIKRAIHLDEFGYQYRGLYIEYSQLPTYIPPDDESLFFHIKGLQSLKIYGMTHHPNNIPIYLIDWRISWFNELLKDRLLLKKPQTLEFKKNYKLKLHLHSLE